MLTSVYYLFRERQIKPRFDERLGCSLIEGGGTEDNIFLGAAELF